MPAQLAPQTGEQVLRSRRRAAVRALVAASTFHHAPTQLQSLGLCSIVVAATARLRHIPVRSAYHAAVSNTFLPNFVFGSALLLTLELTLRR